MCNPCRNRCAAKESSSNGTQAAFENRKRELFEAPVLVMPTEKGMSVLETDALVVAI